MVLSESNMKNLTNEEFVRFCRTIQSENIGSGDEFFLINELCNRIGELHDNYTMLQEDVQRLLDRFPATVTSKQAS